MELLKRLVGRVEHRQDPLLGTWTRINPDRARRPKQTGSADPSGELDSLVRKTRPGCPFCPENRDRETPVFDEGLFQEQRLRRGEVILFPNKNPYGENHCVAILSDDHFIPLDRYDESRLVDSVELSREFFRAVSSARPECRYPVYVWNFLPPSAGSIVHPHIQVLLESRPAPMVDLLAARSRHWKNFRGKPFWQCLVEQEFSLGERSIWRGNGAAVLASFAPRGFREILVILEGSGSLADLTSRQVQTFCRVLIRLLRAYHAMGVGSFNLVTYSAPLGVRDPAFPFHAKLISRPFPSGVYTNDTGFFERMYDLWVIDTLPEDVARRTRPFFEPRKGKTP